MSAWARGVFHVPWLRKPRHRVAPRMGVLGVTQPGPTATLRVPSLVESRETPPMSGVDRGYGALTLSFGVTVFCPTQSRTMVLEGWGSIVENWYGGIR